MNIGLPKAIKKFSPKVTAEYHSIYLIDLPPNSHSLHSELVLRISGHHLPQIKTNNEVAVMSWISKKTAIPIPEIVAYDASEENPISHEYTLLSRVQGATLSEIYNFLDNEQINQMIDHLIDILSQLNAHEWTAIGGLHIDDDGEVIVGQVLEETFWQVPDIVQPWPEGETVATLKIEGPYLTYVEYVSAQIEKYIYLISIHDKLRFMRDIFPRLEALLTVLPKHLNELNDVKLRLVHKDLHFANILYDGSSGRITAILDWEFSSVVPFTKWDPKRAFLWNGQGNTESRLEKVRLRRLSDQRCKERKLNVLKHAAYNSSLQESMQNVADYLRAIVKVVPRDQRQEFLPSWRQTLMENLASFGV